MDKQVDLSVIIPARNEEFLGRTIEDILENAEGNIEVIAVLEGYFPDPALKSDPRLSVIYNPESKGQRTATNQGANLARGKYIMKTDAHCAFDKGFDVKMLEAFKEVGDNVTMIPSMKNLHVFDWLCRGKDLGDGNKTAGCGERRYQSPSGPCEKCGGETTKDVVWRPKPSPNNVAFRFDKTMHFQYWGAWQNRHPEDLVETMSIQGSCFMCTKEKYFELELCGDEFNSWGQQGVEVACKTWLSGGRVIGNRRTWYAHCFRTRGKDFGFPYSNPQSKVNENREISRELFQHDKWPKATRKFQWLLDKFNPPDWDITKGMIYYTDSELDPKIAQPVVDRLIRIGKEKNLGITTSTLGKKLTFGGRNICFPSLKRSFHSMFKQILGALENSSDDIIFFCEADVLYHPSHFDFTPSDDKTFYYNQNVWFLRMTDGHGLHFDVNQLSGLCVYRETALVHFRERYEMVKKEWEKIENAENKDEAQTLFGRFIRHQGFEPFTHGRVPWINQFNQKTWMSELPNVDIKHGNNATGQRWKKEDYRNQKLLVNWTEGEEIPGWGRGMDLVNMLR